MILGLSRPRCLLCCHRYGDQRRTSVCYGSDVWPRRLEPMVSERIFRLGTRTDRSWTPKSAAVDRTGIPDADESTPPEPHPQRLGMTTRTRRPPPIRPILQTLCQRAPRSSHKIARRNPTNHQFAARYDPQSPRSTQIRRTSLGKANLRLIGRDPTWRVKAWGLAPAVANLASTPQLRAGGSGRGD